MSDKPTASQDCTLRYLAATYLRQTLRAISALQNRAALQCQPAPVLGRLARPSTSAQPHPPCTLGLGLGAQEPRTLDPSHHRSHRPPPLAALPPSPARAARVGSTPTPRPVPPLPSSTRTDRNHHNAVLALFRLPQIPQIPSPGLLSPSALCPLDLGPDLTWRPGTGSSSSGSSDRRPRPTPASLTQSTSASSHCNIPLVLV